MPTIVAPGTIRVKATAMPELTAENARLREALVEALSYFEEREDADHNGESYVSNEEMQIAQLIRAAIGETHDQAQFDHEGAT